MSQSISNVVKIKMVYFDKEEAENQSIVFEGTAKTWREKVGDQWDGFEEGDRFLLNNDKVRVFQIVDSFNERSELLKLSYWIAPSVVNPSNIHYEKLN